MSNLFTFASRAVEAQYHDLIIAVADQPEPVPCEIDPEPYTANWSARENASSDSAEELCIECPLYLQCREYGIANKESWGIYGGTLPRDRV